MKKILNWIRQHILITIAIFIVLVISIFLLVYIHNSTHGGIYGDRCKDHEKYSISKSLNTKIVDKYKEIEEVKQVDVSSKLCTVKIIIDIDKDVDIEVFKAKSSEMLTLFKENQLK